MRCRSGVESHRRQGAGDAAGPGARVESPAHVQALRDGFAHGQIGVEAAQRILEDVLYEPRPSERPQRASAEPREVPARSEEHTSELQSLMRISYAVFCLKKKIEN